MSPGLSVLPLLAPRQHRGKGGNSLTQMQRGEERGEREERQDKETGQEIGSGR